MITKDQAINANEFHFGECIRNIGPRGGVTEHREVWRRNGKTQTWITRPDDFRVPVKYGMYEYGAVRNCGDRCEAEAWHSAEDCPLRDPNYVTQG